MSPEKEAQRLYRKVLRSRCGYPCGLEPQNCGCNWAEQEIAHAIREAEQRGYRKMIALATKSLEALEPTI
jgi:hypothetical protein